MMSRKSKRRSSLDGRLSAMRESRGEVGSGGPLSLAGYAPSAPRKSWTRASNTTLWFGLVISIAIVAVAGLAAGGAGGPIDATEAKARIVNEDTHLGTRISNSHVDGTTTTTTTAVASSADLPAAAEAEVPHATTDPLESTCNRIPALDYLYGGGSVDTDARSGDDDATSAAAEVALQANGGGAIIDGASTSEPTAAVAVAGDAEFPSESIVGEPSPEGDTDVSDGLGGAVLGSTQASDVDAEDRPPSVSEDQQLSVASTEKAKAGEEEEDEEEEVCSAAFLDILAAVGDPLDTGATSSSSSSCQAFSAEASEGEAAPSKDKARLRLLGGLQSCPAQEGATSPGAVLASDVGAAVEESRDRSAILPVHVDRKLMPETAGMPWQSSDSRSQPATCSASEAVLEVTTTTDDQAARKEPSFAQPPQQEEFDQEGDDDKCTLTKEGISIVDSVQETERAAVLDSGVQVVEADATHLSADLQPTTRAEEDDGQLPAEALPSCQTTSLWEVVAESDTGPTCPPGPPTTPPLSTAAVADIGGGGCEASPGKLVSPHSADDNRNADSVLLVPGDQLSAAVTISQAKPATTSASRLSSETATPVDTPSGWEEDQAPSLPWHEDGLAAAAVNKADQAAPGMCLAATWGSVLDVWPSTDRAPEAPTEERPMIEAVATPATLEVPPPSCPAVLPTEVFLAAEGAQSQATSRWTPVEELVHPDVETSCSDEVVPATEDDVPLSSPSGAGTVTEKPGIVTATKPKGLFLPWDAGETTCEMVLEHGEEPLEQLPTSPDLHDGGYSQAAAAAAAEPPTVISRAPAARSDKAVAEIKGPVGVGDDTTALVAVDDDDDDDDNDHSDKEEVTMTENPVVPTDGFLMMLAYPRHDVCTPRSSAEESASVAEQGETAVAGGRGGGGGGDKAEGEDEPKHGSEEDDTENDEVVGEMTKGGDGEPGRIDDDGNEKPSLAAAASPAAGDLSTDRAPVLDAPPVLSPAEAPAVPPTAPSSLCDVPPTRGAGPTRDNEHDGGSGGGARPQAQTGGSADFGEKDDKDKDKGMLVVEEGASEKKHGQEGEKRRNGGDGDGDGDRNRDGDGLEARVREFNAWLASPSVEFPVRKVEAGVVGNGMRLGAVATEEIARGEPYLSVPESIVLDASKAREDPELGPPLARLRASLSPQGLWHDDDDSLRVLLIREVFVRRDRSPWAAYLDLLPTPADMRSRWPHPLFFGNGTIAAFEGSDVQATLRQRRDLEVSHFTRVFTAAPESSVEGEAGRELEGLLGEGWITLERYLWATAILESRCIWWDDQKHLVPLLDLVNNAQAPPPTSVHETFQDSDGNAITVSADYGHPNHVLLLVHGFSLGRENRHDCVRIDAQRPSREHNGAGYWETLARLEAPQRDAAMPSVDSQPPSASHEQRQQQRQEERYALAAGGDGDHPECAARSSPTCPTPAAAAVEAASAAATPLSDRDQRRECGTSMPATTASDSNGPGPIPSAATSGVATVVVDPSWEALRDDPGGVRAVLDVLEPRLEGYGGGRGTSACQGYGGVDGFDGEEARGCSCAAKERSSNNNSNNDNDQDGDALWTISVEETARSFLDSEQRLLRELYDYLVPLLPPAGVPVLPGDHDGHGSRVSQNNASSSSGGGGVGTIPTMASSEHAMAGSSSSGCPTCSGEGDITTTAAAAAAAAPTGCGGVDVGVVDSDNGEGGGGGGGRPGLTLNSCGEGCGVHDGEGE
eukprot:g4951.t1